jgi:Flp pilus assembly protein TadD
MSRLAHRTRRLAVLCAALGVSALVSACASGPADRAGLRPGLDASTETVAPTPVVSPQASLYGLFLAGEAALEKGSSRDAAFYLGRVSELAPEAGFLKERAFTAALIAGDVEKAAALAPGEGEGSIATQRLGQVARAVELMARGRGADAGAILVATSTQGSTGSAVVLLRYWAAAMAGDWTAATAPATGDQPITRMFGALSRARLLERNGKLAEADAAFAALNGEGDNGLFTLAYGAFLERRGRRADAVVLYGRSLARSSDVSLEHARERAKSGRPPALGSLQDGAAETLLAPAALQITRRQPEVALALLRLALRLDPDQDDAWMLVGDSMASAGDVAASREAYAKVKPNAAEYGTAQSRLAWSLQRAGDKEGALKLARAQLDRSKDSLQAMSAYAELLRENARYAESAEMMDRLIERGVEGPDGWRLYFMRGVSLDQIGRWEKAEADLQKALALKPEEPDVMNYLGFGWADRGQRLSEALNLLEKAAGLRPRSGEIRDSLGWARYRLGQYPDAVRDLERAVSLTPADPSVNDHLGDAYWQVGRRLEAEFQWRRVLTLEPTPELRSAVEAKLITRGEGVTGTLASAGALQ